LDEAFACYKKSIELDPKSPFFSYCHASLGRALMDVGRMDEGLVCYEKAVELLPKHGYDRWYLGLARLKLGRLDEAVASLRRTIDLGAKSARSILARADKTAAAREKFDDFLAGRYNPATNAERLGMAEFCRVKKRNHAAARLYADAFAADPKEIDVEAFSDRYAAAAVASLAAAGQGEDAAGLDETERTRLRKQALGWLRDGLDFWLRRFDGKLFNDAGALPSMAFLDVAPVHRSELQGALRRWRRDPDLAGIRDPDALAQLPDAEREACQAFWKDVESFIQSPFAPRR
jgi:tetratricopeptide (TPR) repeat protein